MEAASSSIRLRDRVYLHVKVAEHGSVLGSIYLKPFDKEAWTEI